MIKIFEGFLVDVFKNSTGTSWYDNFLSPKDSEYMKFNKGAVGRLLNMTADDYFKVINDSVFDIEEDSPENYVDESSTVKYSEMMKSGIKFDMPYINLHPYFGPSQEGRHRMVAMMLAYGKLSEGTVLIIEPYVPDENEIKEYCKKRYGRSEKEFEWGVDYIKRTLSHYLGYDI